MRLRKIVLGLISIVLLSIVIPIYVGVVQNVHASTGVLNAAPMPETLWLAVPVLLLGGAWLLLMRRRRTQPAPTAKAPTPAGIRFVGKTTGRPEVLGTTADGQVIERTGFGKIRRTPAAEFPNRLGRRRP